MNRKIPATKIIYTALFIAAALILPQIFHFGFGAAAGKMFLPMHIPVIICGMLIGPFFGAVSGIISPVLSFLVSGMPNSSTLPLMMLELCIYGILAGLVSRRFGSYITLFITITGGRIINMLCLYIASFAFMPDLSPAASVYASFIAGIPGIIIQFIIIPPIIKLIKKSGVIK